MKLLHSALIIFALLCVSACSSISNIDLNPFDSDDERQEIDGKELSKEQQAMRDALLAGKSSRPPLASLDLQPVRSEDVAIPVLSLIEKRDEYEALLPLITDPIQQQQVAFRLADIKMLIAEQQQEEGVLSAAGISAVAMNAGENGVYADAISDYRAVLQAHSIVPPAIGTTLSSAQQALNRKQMDAMYQLTRALDLSAKTEESVEVAKQFLSTFDIEVFDITPYHIELYFRIGEYYFNRQQYPNAAQYYSQVVDFGKSTGSISTAAQTDFYAISAYMLGWSHFKLDDYASSMQAFGNMLDASLYSIAQIDSTPLVEVSLSKGELRLVKDAVRVMALTFSYQGNGEAIAAFYALFGNREYEHLIYDELAQQHLDNDRFQDSANALFEFASAYPTHPRAVEFYIRHIDAFVLGGFPERVLLAKAQFVQSYSLGNGVVNSLNTPIGRDATPYLKDYITQLAQTEHSIAQGIDAILASRLQDAEQSANKGFVANAVSEQQSKAWQLASNDDLLALSREAYSKAKDYYENYIRSFSPSDEVAQLRFYLAEALFALNEYRQAIEAFETYAYFDTPNPQAVEAAYAALLAYDKLAENNQLPKPKVALSESSLKYQAPLSLHQKSQAKFAQSFGADNRAPMVALTLMQALFNQQNYLPAQDWARWLLDNTAREVVTFAMQESAQLVMAHSYFAMQRYASAESEYRILLTQLPANDERRAELRDRLAASLYKQGENMLVQAELDTAGLQAKGISNKSQLSAEALITLEKGVSFLQQVVKETPESEFRLAAQFDSAVYFSLLERWPEAIATLLDFQQRFAEHPLAKGIDDQLFYAYQQTENWPQAAIILLSKYNAAPNTEAGRLALYQAAQFYEKAGDRAKALDNFRRYAHQYPMPLAQANEARFTLSEYYLESGEDSKRRFWLNKLVQAQLDIQNSSTNSGSPRSVFLASMAAMVFASDADNVYSRIKLTQPLAQSLQKKQSALQKAITQYDRVMAFGSADYVAQANYRLANLYLTLAEDLMNSTRPKDLSALELSQYEILLEEQAYPFEETAINLHENNIARVQSGLYDDWVKQSFSKLKSIMPGRYNKPEQSQELSADDF